MATDGETPGATATTTTPAPNPVHEASGIKPDSPIGLLLNDLGAIVAEAEHGEMWGVALKDINDVPTTIVLEKFLRANDNNFDAARKQLVEALQWREKTNPIKLLEEVEFDSEKFEGLGYVSVYESEKGVEVVTWNIYGAAKNLKKTFGNVDDFVLWRSALMELSVKHLKLDQATEYIKQGGEDPYKMVQVHDYLNVSFLRMDPAVKASSKATITTLSMAYPELLSQKFFVNVPLVMGWVFAAMKLFLSPATVRRFHPLSYGSALAGEIPEIGDKLPKEYGGKGPDAKEGLTVKYAATEKPSAPATTTEAAEPAERKKDLAEQSAPIPSTQATDPVEEKKEVTTSENSLPVTAAEASGPAEVTKPADK
ncbi:CRAL-TRIO domain-containing protein [Tricladium varicosporioides]|nr:CRAL-TRIO domain-containing protein [Hymenoscyphus varicosporioides]